MSVSDDNLVEFVKFSWSASELSESGEEVEEEMEIMASRATPSTCRWAALILIVRGSLLGDSSVVVNQSDILKLLLAYANQGVKIVKKMKRLTNADEATISLLGPKGTPT